ncbi:MAG: methyltransferase domain-containing protein [Gammaproteobacteria bacterium]|jgi:ubiquinone/menaquinone biosynthesis C-methylase UbiE|nr:methyltransferase domain-containing protein [Gammaproteobacteria bacterium]MBT4491879.1 methyltransferase domain-containing protein [Gammaproteobacteria bacterium]MBT7370407.1 methyltransferase domain-containing protein [Gammaproteobacteria bacterium]
MSEHNPEALQAFAGQVSASVTGGLNCALTLLGDQLGLYRSLSAAGPMNSAELAESTRLSERWVREWLYQQACIKQIEYRESDDRFFLSEEAKAVLADDRHPANLIGMFQSVVAIYDSVDTLPDCFRTGIGHSYDDKGENCACGIERMTKRFQTDQLVPDLLPRLDGLVEMLQNGVKVADVGCGGASSTIAMAKVFPESQFIGYDISMHALNRARNNINAAGVKNVTLHNAIDNPLPNDASFDLITTFDVIHDSTHPDQLITAIRQSLKDTGIWLCADIKGMPTFAENLKDNPMATVAYSFSVLMCMSAGLSTPDGAGLGTLGFHEQKARTMTQEAGFSRFKTIPYDPDMFNAYYEIRP